MNTTQTLEEAEALGYLVSSREQTTNIFPEWMASCRAAAVPCSSVRLSANGDGGTVVVAFPRKRQPSPDCRAEMLASAQWAISQNERPTNVDVCRHELMAGYVRCDAVDGLITEIVRLWQTDQGARRW